jgi:hypothetical protein
MIYTFYVSGQPVECLIDEPACMVLVPPLQYISQFRHQSYPQMTAAALTGHVCWVVAGRVGFECCQPQGTAVASYPYSVMSQYTSEYYSAICFLAHQSGFWEHLCWGETPGACDIALIIISSQSSSITNALIHSSVEMCQGRRSIVCQHHSMDGILYANLEGVVYRC